MITSEEIYIYNGIFAFAKGSNFLRFVLETLKSSYKNIENYNQLWTSARTGPVFFTSMFVSTKLLPLYFLALTDALFTCPYILFNFVRYLNVHLSSLRKFLSKKSSYISNCFLPRYTSMIQQSTCLTRITS